MHLSHYLKIWQYDEKPGYQLLYSTKKGSLVLIPDENLAQLLVPRNPLTVASRSLFSAPTSLRLQFHSAAMRLQPRLVGTKNSFAILQHLMFYEVLEGKEVQEYTETLAGLGMLVPDPGKEKAEVFDFLSEINRLNPGINITVILGLECNFACIYCYEGSMKGKFAMDDATADQLVAFAKDLIRPGKEKITLDFYGGEPLLYTRLIKRIVGALKPYAEEKGLEFRFTLVTNGSLLTRRMAEELVPYGLYAAKITVDGPAGTHNKTRPFKTGQPSFDLILKNIKECLGIIKIGVGGNFSRDNFNEFPHMFDDLAALDLTPDQIGKVQFSPVSQTCDEYSNPEFTSGCSSCDEPWVAEASNLYKLIISLRYPLELLLSVAVAPMLWSELTNAVAVHDFFTASSIILFIVASAYLIYISRPKVHLPSLPDTCNFRFGGEDTQWKPWPRQTQLEEAVEAVKSAQNHVVVAVSGPSGAGKSTFLADELVPRLTAMRKFKPMYFDEYSGELPVPNLYDEHLTAVIIYDQFEHLLLQLEHTDNEVALSGLVKTKQKIVELLAVGCVVVVSVRAENYYNLKFLVPYLPQVEKTINVGLVNLANDPSVIKAFQAQMRGMGADSSDLGAGSYSLLEMQSRLALEELCRKADCSGREGLQKITTHSSPQMLVDWYVDDSPRISASCRVLYALHQRPPGCGLTIKALAYVVGDSVNRVQEVCKYLELRGLLRRDKSSVAFKIAHDALRPCIEASTSERLRPNERDCIASALQTADDSRWSDALIDQDRVAKISLSVPVMTFLAILGILRLFIYWDKWNTLSFVPDNVRGAGYADPLYLAIMVPHLLWCLYVASHDYHVFRFSDTTLIQRVVSHATVLNLIGSNCTFGRNPS